MKVICIDTSDRGFGNVDELIEGNIYNVACEFFGVVSGIRYYGLIEFPGFEIGVSGFHADRFVPLSEIDETEMERNYNTQHA